MSKEGEFYEDENEDFEELMEKSLIGDKGTNQDEDETNLLSDMESSEDEIIKDDEVAIKREQRLKQKMNMTRNPLANVQIGSNSDEQVIQRRIAMLCSALGGFDPNPPNRYILGVEAIGCLRDIKTMLNRIDQEKNVFIVASACHDSGLVVNDLIPIMVQYGLSDVENGQPEAIRLLLASLELMVRLMQPIELNNDNLDDSLVPKLKRAQIEYKYHLLHHRKGKIFKYIMALMVPILKKEKKDINKRDNTILNLCLTLCINVMRIQASDVKEARKSRTHVVHVFEELPVGVSEEDISIDKVLEIFSKYNVLAVIQTVTSNLSTDFETKILSSTCLDFFFYTFFHLDPSCTATNKVTPNTSSIEILAQQLNLSDSNLVSSSQQDRSSNLTQTNNRLLLLQKQEHGNVRRFKAKSSTRHAHFGSLINVQDNKHGNRILSGQDKLRNDNIIGLFDSNVSKTASGNIQVRRKAEALGSNHKFVKVQLKTIPLLDMFVNDFIKNGFGILCSEIYNNYLKQSDISNSKLNFRYFFLIDWILKFEKAYQRANKRGIRHVERYNYLLYCFSNESIKTLMNIFIPTFLKARDYDSLNMAVSVFNEIMEASLAMHSYKDFKGDFLLKEDQDTLNKLQSISEATLRTIFETRSEIEELTKLPQNAHIRTPAVGMRMIEFTHTLQKTLSYITNLKIPIYITRKRGSDTNNEDGTSSMNRTKQLDKNLCRFYETKIFHDRTVSTHIWLMNQFQDVDESKLRYCLSYFGKLLENWKENIFKLVRLDFMYTLYQMKQSNLSDKTKQEFGDMMSAFMHCFSKMCSHSKMFLLEPMVRTELLDGELREYFITGDPFSTSNLTNREQREMNRNSSHEDISFIDESLSDNQKITYIITHLYFNDNTGIVETLCEFLNQWYHELNYSLIETVKIAGKIGTFRLDGPCMKEYRINPYFRYLCKIGNITNGILVSRETPKLKTFKEQIEIALNTPLDDHELENIFDDPNKLRNTRINKANDGYSDDEDGFDGDDNLDYKNHGYGSEGIDDDDDLAGSESDTAEVDELDLMEAKLRGMSNRVKGKAMKRNADGTLTEMGKRAKIKAKQKKSKRSRSSQKLRKRRKIVKDDNVELLSDAEIERRSRLSKDRIEDSDEEMDDDAFYERDLKLHQLLQKRHGMITKAQYEALVDGTLDLDDVSDLDDKLVGTQNAELPQSLQAPDRDTLASMLQPGESGDDDSDDSDDDGDDETGSSSDDEDDSQSSDDNESEIDTLDKIDINDVDKHTDNSNENNVISTDDKDQIAQPKISSSNPAVVFSDDEMVVDKNIAHTSAPVSDINTESSETDEDDENTSETSHTGVIDTHKSELPTISAYEPEDDVFSSLKKLHAMFVEDEEDSNTNANPDK